MPAPANRKGRSATILPAVLFPSPNGDAATLASAAGNTVQQRDVAGRVGPAGKQLQPRLHEHVGRQQGSRLPVGNRAGVAGAQRVYFCFSYALSAADGTANVVTNGGSTNS
jgi:hypothetical protein